MRMRRRQLEQTVSRQITFFTLIIDKGSTTMEAKRWRWVWVIYRKE